MTLPGMAQNFIACDRDQVLLLPPDLREWLPGDHLARFVIETVEQLDLADVYGYYRQDGRGRPAHDPAMMLGLLLYAYAVGVTSSRAIERKCVDDVAFRVISVNEQPDHSTIARFLIRHRDAIEGLFFDVLALCRQAGMVRVGTVAVDSTKLAANASAARSLTLEGLEAEAARIIEEAIETDRREDELYGDRRGDELPDELADPRTRKARIKELLEQARRERAAAQSEREQKLAEHQEHFARTGKRKRGRPPKPDAKRPGQRLLKKYNLTDPDSGLVRTSTGGFVQGYNVQTVVSEDQIILAVRASGINPDQGQLARNVQSAHANLQRIGVTGAIVEVLADGGYWNGRQVRELTADGYQVLVPPGLRSRSPGGGALESRQMQKLLETEDGNRRYQQRQRIIEPVFGQIKHNRGIRRLLRRGQAAVQTEIALIATTHNLLKLRGALATG
jgi:transposase